MTRALVILTASAVVASAFFPTIGFGGRGGKEQADPDFVRDDAKQVVIDQKKGRMYYDGNGSKPMNFHAATDYCASMDHLGYGDWRVPTKREMRSLLENSRRDVAIKHAFQNVSPEIYWSSTVRRDKAWYFDFNLGRYGKRKMEYLFRVFCVRDAR